MVHFLYEFTNETKNIYFWGRFYLTPPLTHACTYTVTHTQARVHAHTHTCSHTCTRAHSVLKDNYTCKFQASSHDE